MADVMPGIMADEKRMNTGTDSEISASDSVPLIDPEAERRLRRKCDIHIIPVLFVLYILSFLDRINIGNARIQGLESDLKMKGNDYNVALLIFFVPYILLEVPSNILLKRIKPSTYLSTLITLWGMQSRCNPTCKDVLLTQ